MTEHLSRETLSALLDGECDLGERRWAHEHLQECEQCREAMDGFASVQRLVKGLPRLVAPHGLVDQALRRSPTLWEAARRAFRGTRRRVAVAAAAAAAVVTLGGLAAPAERSEPPVDEFVTHHVGVNGGSPSAGQVIFAVTGR